MKKNLTILLVVCGLGWAGFTLFKEYFHRVEVNTRSGFSTEARNNSLLALQRYYNELGHQVDSRLTIEVIDDLARQADSLTSAQVMVFANLSSELNAQQIQQLMAWIKDGGHVIASISGYRNLAHNTVPWLADLDININGVGSICKTPSVVPSRPRNSTTTIKLESSFANFLHTSKINETSATQDSLLDALVSPCLSHDLSVQDIDSEHASYFMLKRQIGSGTLTLLAHGDLFTNNKIDKQDNAFFAQYLLPKNSDIAQPNAPALAIWLIADDTIRSFWQGIWQRSKYALISLLCFVFGWFNYKAYRTGRIDDEPPPKRAEYGEHLHAIGRYAWRHGSQEELFQQNREYALRLCRQHSTHFDHADTSTWQELVNNLDIDAQHLQRIFQKPVGSTRDFTLASQYLQNLIKALEARPFND